MKADFEEWKVTEDRRLLHHCIADPADEYSRAEGIWFLDRWICINCFKEAPEEMADVCLLGRVPQKGVKYLDSGIPMSAAWKALCHYIHMLEARVKEQDQEIFNLYTLVGKKRGDQ